MSTKFAVEGKTGRGDSFKFDPDDIIVSDFTGRRFGPSEESISKMVTSLLADGQLQDVGIRKNFEGKPVLIFGNTRYHAVKRINDQKLSPEPFLLSAKYFQVNEEEAAIMTLLENNDDTRTPVSPIDLAFFIRQLETRYGYTDKEIAEKLHKKPTDISNLRKLLELDTPTQKRIASGEINLHTALTLTKVAPADRSAVLALATETKGTNGNGKPAKITSAKVVATARAVGAKTKQPVRRTLPELKAVLKICAPKKRVNAVSALMAFLDGEGSEEDLIEVLKGLDK